MQCADGNELNKLAHHIADVIDNGFIPFHRRARGQQRCESLHRGKPLQPIFIRPLNTRNGGQFCFPIAVTGCFPAPRTTIDKGFAIHDAEDGVVVVEQFASWNVGQPQPHVRALPRATFQQLSTA